MVLVGSLVLSLVLVPVALAVAVRFGALDHPGPAKGHTKAVPYLGGAAIVVAFAVTPWTLPRAGCLSWPASWAWESCWPW